MVLRSWKDLCDYIRSILSVFLKHNGIYIGNSVVDLAKHILRSTSCKKLYIGEIIFRFKGKYIKSVAEQDAYNTEVHAAS